MNSVHVGFSAVIISVIISVAYLTGRSAGRLEAEHFWHLKCQSLGDVHARTLRELCAQINRDPVVDGIKSKLPLSAALDELIQYNADIRAVVFGMEYFLHNQDIDLEGFSSELQLIINDIVLDYRNQTQLFNLGRYRGDH